MNHVKRYGGVRKTLQNMILLSESEQNDCGLRLRGLPHICQGAVLRNLCYFRESTKALQKRTDTSIDVHADHIEQSGFDVHRPGSLSRTKPHSTLAANSAKISEPSIRTMSAAIFRSRKIFQKPLQ